MFSILLSHLNRYILFLKDEKLQDVLGHFQKDFEGGVSAENLGKLEHSGIRVSCKLKECH